MTRAERDPFECHDQPLGKRHMRDTKAPARAVSGGIVAVSSMHTPVCGRVFDRVGQPVKAVKSRSPNIYEYSK